MPATFISYRRDDAAGYAGRLHESLERRLVGSGVFRDVDTLQPGQDFVRAIEARLAECRVMLVVIGREWIDARNVSGSRRLDDPRDFVRIEVAAALARPDVLVVPVLVEGASMPVTEQLPEDLQSLVRRQAVSIRDETWDADVDRLGEVVEKAVPSGAALPVVTPWVKSKGLIVAAAAVVVLVAVAIWLYSTGSSADPASPATASAAGGSFTPYTIDVPPVAEVALGDVIYALVSGNVSARENDNELRVRIRVSNFGRQNLNFWDESFRLIAGGQTLAPVSGLNVVVGGNSLQYGVVSFRVPRQTRQATLQIMRGKSVAQVRIELSPTGRPPVDEQAEIADSMSQAIRESVVRDAAPLLTAAGLTVTLDRASTRRFANVLRLLLTVRVVNSGARPVFPGDVVMRVAAGDALIVPLDWPFEVFEPQATATETVTFDLPTTTTAVTLKTTIGAEAAQFPIRITR